MPLKAREYEKNQQLRGANLLYIGDREKWLYVIYFTYILFWQVARNNNLKIIRPGTGIHPKYLTFLIGRTLLKDINKNEIIPEDAFWVEIKL